MRPLFAADRTAVAGWLSIDSAYAAEVAGSAGFDAVVIDAQHGIIDPATTVAMLQALSHTPAVPLVRVSQNNLAEVNRALDAGAYGVICPLVNSALRPRRLRAPAAIPRWESARSAPHAACFTAAPTTPSTPTANCWCWR